jgi:hypothetical protein
MQQERSDTKTLKKKIRNFIVILIILSPLGILIPDYFNSGEAWGEWSAERLNVMLGFVPERLKNLSDLWHAPFRDYNIPGLSTSLLSGSVSYVISAVIAVILLWLFFKGLSYLLWKNER